MFTGRGLLTGRGGRKLAAVSAAVIATLGVVTATAPGARADNQPDDFIFGYSGGCQAQLTITAGSQTVLNSTAQGWTRDDGAHSSNNPNYIVGHAVGQQFRDYFVFDLSSVTGTITAASIDIPNSNCGASGTGNLSTYALWDVTSSLSDVEAAHNAGDSTGLAVYADLGSGTGYGSAPVTAINASDVPVTLNAAAITALQAAEGSQFAVGGTYAEGPQSQTIDFPQPTTPAAYGTSDTLAAIASSGLGVSYTVDASSTAGACTVSGSTVSYTGVGSCVIDANQAGNASYSAAPQVQRTVTVTKAATTTTLTVNPPSPAVNQPTTLTATVHYTGSGAAPTGTVSFYDGTTLLGTAPVQSDGTATLTTTFGGGPHSITATYSGDSHYLSSTSNPATPVNVFCDQYITGTHAALTVTSGTTCLINATITGGISVGRGASLSVQNSTVQGSISANHPATVRICGSTTGSIAVSGATGYVRIGDPNNNCAPNTITGGLTAANNTGGGAIIGNTITGGWTITNNTPAFTVTGNHH